MSAPDAPSAGSSSAVAPGATTSAPSPTLPKSKSGARAALEYTGIPPSWFEKRPRLPSRNWLIFLSVTAGLTGLYVYDRREVKRVRAEYVDRVKHLGEVPLHPMDLPRKVRVLGARWPGDEDHERNTQYFRKYVKPVLVAAAVDYELVSGKRHGDIAELIADEVKARRRIAAGLDPPPQSPIPQPVQFTPEEKRRRELAGGTVIVGRNTFKEYLAGLKRGWTEPLDRVDKDAALAEILAKDGVFDEPPEEESNESPAGALEGEPLPTRTRLGSGNTPPPLVFSPLQAQMRAMEPKAQPAPSTARDEVPAHLNVPPAQIAQFPPLLLVSHTNLIGLSQIPRMMWEWFNERHKARSGAEEGYRLVMAHTRSIRAPAPAPTEDGHFVDPAVTSEATFSANGEPSDLDFDRHAESFYKSSLNKLPQETESARASYYKKLPAQLEVARALARRTREPTSDELATPPPTEVELRAECAKKEARWRGDLAGWDIIKPDAEPVWDERFRAALSVFTDPPAEVVEHSKQEGTNDV